MSPNQSLRLSTKPGTQIQSSEDAANTWVEEQGTAKTVDQKSVQKVKRITFEVNEQQHQAIKIHAARQGMTIKELMQSLVEQALESPQEEG